MKTLLTALVAILLVGTVAAQTRTVIYSDSLIGTTVTTTAVHARGFDVFKLLSTDAISHRDLKLSVKFIKTTDSLKLQGAKVNFGIDTTWEDVPVTKRLISAINTGGGGSVSRDTTAIWITPLTTGLANYSGHNPGSTGLLDVPSGYKAYRAVSGKNDSGKVYMQWSLIRNQ